MRIDTLSPAQGATKPVKRLGRGIGSGTGKTSGKGHKGQWARSGGGVRPGFEGGQIPLSRRLPKRGFNNIFAKEYAIVNVETINSAFEDGAVVNAETLVAAGVLKKTLDGVKVLGRGEITKKVTVQATIFSASAKEKIEAVGGTCEVV